MNNELLRLSAQRALLFAVTPALRFLSIEVSGDSLRMNVHLDAAPSGDEKDNYFGVSAEIVGDFVELESSQSVTKFIVDPNSYEDLVHLAAR